MRIGDGSGSWGRDGSGNSGGVGGSYSRVPYGSLDDSGGPGQFVGGNLG